MHFRLRVGEFPESSIIRIPEQHIPSTSDSGDLSKYLPGKILDPFTCCVSKVLAALKTPLANQNCFGWFEIHHSTILVHAPGGIGWLEIT